MLAELFEFRTIFFLLWMIGLASLIAICGIWIYRTSIQTGGLKEMDLRLLYRFFAGSTGLLALAVIAISAWYLKYEPDDFLAKGTLEYEVQELSGRYTLISDSSSWSGFGLKLEVPDNTGAFSYEYNTSDELFLEPKTGMIDPFLNMIEFTNDSLGRGKIIKDRSNVIKLVFPSIEFQKMGS
ncbi:MAG: hypothetical protein AAF587_14395 [Bacteroidota bacterium]